METWLQTALTVITTFGASSGLWAFLLHRDKAKSATTRLLMGIAYEHITTFGVSYINRGWVSKDEYEELQKYFYEPYKALGGNGFAERVMVGVGKLPLRPTQQYEAVFHGREPREINDVRVVARQTAESDAQ